MVRDERRERRRRVADVVEEQPAEALREDRERGRAQLGVRDHHARALEVADGVTPQPRAAAQHIPPPLRVVAGRVRLGRQDESNGAREQRRRDVEAHRRILVDEGPVAQPGAALHEHLTVPAVEIDRPRGGRAERQRREVRAERRQAVTGAQGEVRPELAILSEIEGVQVAVHAVTWREERVAHIGLRASLGDGRELIEEAPLVERALRIGRVARKLRERARAPIVEQMSHGDALDDIGAKRPHDAAVDRDDAAAVLVRDRLDDARGVAGEIEQAQAVAAKAPQDGVLMVDVDAAAPAAREREQRVPHREQLGVALMGVRAARVEGLRGGEQREARARDVRIEVRGADRVGALVQGEADGEVLAPPEEVVLRERGVEQRQGVLLEFEVRVEAQAPHVARDGQQVDGVRTRRHDGHDGDDTRQLGLAEGTSADRERGRRLQVADALLDERIVVALARLDEQLALQDPGARRAVEDVEELKIPVAPREDLLVDDGDRADGLALGMRFDLQPQRRERLVDGLLLEPPQGRRRFRAGGAGREEAREEADDGEDERCAAPRAASRLDHGEHGSPS
ncbi:MAG: hypothetical protein JWM82_3463 [Myxococcales bacterium]|nr:hypothetical protein [Myxococcales bacterium]